MSNRKSGQGMSGNPEKAGSGVDNEKDTAAIVQQIAPMTLAAVRQELKGVKGKRYWQSVDELGHFLVNHYKIRTPKDLTSCEVCHR